MPLQIALFLLTWVLILVPAVLVYRKKGLIRHPIVRAGIIIWTASVIVAAAAVYLMIAGNR